ncbi:MAG: hypothetical protein IKS10_06675 [Lachnospiraceae bacterium]|nr:hypothetical protein [Lachnospiraceae bacterium]
MDFNSIKEGAVNLAKSVGKKTSDTVESVKVKGKISTEEKAIKATMLEIGQYVWDRFEEGEIVSEDLISLCETIRDHYHNIDTFKKDLEDKKAGNVPEEEPEVTDSEDEE